MTEWAQESSVLKKRTDEDSSVTSGWLITCLREGSLWFLDFDLERKRIIWQGRYSDHEDDCILDKIHCISNVLTPAKLGKLSCVICE